ncbi:MAG: anti-sigma factor [Casimicrobiaceae bacterium]|nr:anti-sigma factor [Casimicrobiaceae bacterium]MDW8313242.1 anti-sigma factor [Burkholderiales bacterium]
MDYARRPLADWLAAKYVLGTLRGAARRRFERLLPAHRSLQEAVAAWESRLGTLASTVDPVEPNAEVWQRIQRRLFPTEVPVPWWRRLGLWQGATALASLVGVVLAWLALREPVLPPPIIVVLSEQPAAAQAGLRAAAFVASVGGDGRQLVIRPLDAEQTRLVGRVFELWAVPQSGPPRSLGLLAEGRPSTLPLPNFFREAAALAVSVEPPGGSPTGAPTGPVVAVGSLRL